ncbi:MAG: type II secretion system F family protein [Deltaproteobacteria bacterium]|nr:type II secretion system F family protein [Deltaproteobacteria bacterium]
MPNFKYKVRDRLGRSIAGTIDAPTLQIAGDRLYQLGYFPIDIKEEGRSALSDLSEFWLRFQKVKMEDLIFFSQQLSTLYKAGLPLLAGMESLIEQTENKKLKSVLAGIQRQIEGGSTLSQAISRYPDVFPLIYINMIRAGETSGMLGESMDRFVTLADRELRTRQRVKEATRYPKIIVVSLIIALGVLVIFVIPRFAIVFAQFKTPLPLPTRALIGINDVFQAYWYLILLGAGGIPLLIKRYLGTESGKNRWDRWKLHIPVFGQIFLKIALSQFAYTFVMLNRSGIPILQTLEVTSGTIQNTHLSQTIDEMGLKIKEGKSLTAAMRETKRFTPLVIQMVSVGESSGSLDKMLMSVTEYYDREAENAIKKMSAYIEPILTLFMGVSILFLALAVFLPWWNVAALFR